MSKEHERVGTFCDKCRQVMCKCVLKEQTAPKEIWIHQSDIKELNTYMLASNALIYSIVRGNIDNSEYNKYLSETHVFEILDAKDKQIDGQRRIVQSFKDRYYEQIELIDSKNKELESKDKEIRDLVKLVAERHAELAEKEREIEQLKKQLEK